MQEEVKIMKFFRETAIFVEVVIIVVLILMMISKLNDTIGRKEKIIVVIKFAIVITTVIITKTALASFSLPLLMVSVLVGLITFWTI